jgi:hypothetical protein
MSLPVSELAQGIVAFRRFDVSMIMEITSCDSHNGAMLQVPTPYLAMFGVGAQRATRRGERE